jgi:5-methylcytosine-specific restriction endonuclease McrBC regulatory subunit McrC
MLRKPYENTTKARRSRRKIFYKRMIFYILCLFDGSAEALNRINQKVCYRMRLLTLFKGVFFKLFQPLVKTFSI